MWVCFALTTLLSVIWLIHRKKSKEKPKITPTEEYTTAQKFGILGILVFLFPILLIVLFELSRGILILIIFLLRLLHLPDQFVSVSISIIYGILFSLSFVLLFPIGKYIWPKKKEIKA